MPDGPILVTGAAGFVGSAVTRALLARGCEVRVTVRPGSPRGNLADMPVEIVEGDMRDAADAARAVAGMRHVFHVAADYRLWARDPEEIVRNNVAITRNVMLAALEAGVERVVYTSSVAALRPDPQGPADETRVATPAQAVGAYKRSKVEAERLVLELIATRGLPAVIVSPSTPVGPHDVRPTPTGRIVVEAANGHMPAFVDCGLNLVHVDDVAEGHLMALERGRIGERYILGGQDVSLREMLAVIAGLSDRRAPTIGLPGAPLIPLAWANEALSRVTGREPFLTRDALQMARHKMYFTSAKAGRELGYHARPFQEALGDAIAWFRAAGKVALQAR